MLTLKQAIEALVFASPKPLTLEEIRKALRGAAADTEDLNIIAMGETTEEEIASQLNLLRAEYEQTGRAFQVAEQVNGWAMVTVPAAGDWVRQLYPESRPTRLSGPALETLAIIAYRQPVTRADIEAVRGVAVDGVMQVLLDRQLVKIAGRAELPGRPLLYETTEYFLQHFGIKDVVDLPNSDELRRVNLPKAEYPEEGAEKAEKPSKKKGKAAKDAAAAEGATAENTAGGSAPAETTATDGGGAPSLPESQSDTAEPAAGENTEPAPEADPTSDASVVYDTEPAPPEEASQEPPADSGTDEAPRPD
jgi:segregation and condensation protein B